MNVRRTILVFTKRAITRLAGHICWRNILFRIVALIDRLEIDETPNTLLKHRSRATRTQIATARALRISKVLGVEDRTTALKDGVSLGVSAGDIIGLAGITGAGQSELLGAPGRIWPEENPVDFRHTREAIASGVAFVPEDRLISSAFLDLSVHSNRTMTVLRSAMVSRQAGALRGQASGLLRATPSSLTAQTREWTREC